MDFAACRPVNTGEHAHYGAFASTVLAEQRMYFPSLGLEIYLIARKDAAEPLYYAAHIDGMEVIHIRYLLL
jgi:hypothetical protein